MSRLTRRWTLTLLSASQLVVKHPMPHGSLWSQSGSFWLGAFMIAEAPVGLVISFLNIDRRWAVADYVFSSPLTFVCALVALASMGLFAGWLGHRLGFGG